MWKLRGGVASQSPTVKGTEETGITSSEHGCAWPQGYLPGEALPFLPAWVTQILH